MRSPLSLPAYLLVLLYATLVPAAQTFFPGTIPLAVRSPYLSTWHYSKNGSAPLSNAWPNFWTGNGIMGWTCKIRVDGATYGLMGNDGINNATANVTSVEITPTRSIYSMQAGPMNVNVTFLSPIEPSDWVKQSMPFSYLSVAATAADGNTHDVQMYSDISAEWLSGNRSDLVKWTNENTGSSVYHEINVQDPQPFTQIADQAQDGTAYFAMATRPGLTWEIDTDVNNRNLFKSQGSLANSASTAFGVIGPPWPVFSIAVDLGTIQSTSDPVAWAIGYVRDPSVKYTTATGETQERRPYYTTQYPSSISNLIDAFTGDFSAANDRAIALDAQIMGDAAKISSNYVDLVSLASRQTLATLDITVSTDSNGNVDPTDVMIFMKDIGSSERVNPVERMFAAFPMFLYLNSSLAGAMLRPLLEAQDSLTDQPYASPDLGTSYPVASGDTGDVTLGLEDTGNMLIMTYAHARFSGNGTLIAEHYNTTRRWADYLVNNTLLPQGQADADGEKNANMTNLAIKGIIGVKAMAEMARAAGQDADAQTYDNQANALIGSWQSLALSTGSAPRLLGEYDQQNSWALMYNIFADTLLGTNLVSQTILGSQTKYYDTLLSTALTYGLPIDSSAGNAVNAAWTLFTAATVNDTGVRDQLITSVWNKAGSNLTANPFPSMWNGQTGVLLSGNGGPAVGSMFSHLALTLSNTTINVPAITSTTTGSSPDGTGSDSGKKSNAGAIAGGVIGAAAAITLCIGAFFWWRKRRDGQPSGYYYGDKPDMIQEPHRPTLPYYHDDPTATSGALSGADDTSMPISAPGGPYDSVSALGMSAPLAGAGAMSAKTRERLMNMPRDYTPSLSPSSVVGGGTATGSVVNSDSSREPLSPGTMTGSGSGSGTGSAISPTDVLGLRAEVENLRRVMQAIRTDRLEPPPEYHSEYGQ